MSTFFLDNTQISKEEFIKSLENEVILNKYKRNNKFFLDGKEVSFHNLMKRAKKQIYCKYC